MHIAMRILCGVSLALSVAITDARADSYPSKPVRVIVPYGPGGIADVTMRMVAQDMSKRPMPRCEQECDRELPSRGDHDHARDAAAHKCGRCENVTNDARGNGARRRHKQHAREPIGQ